jgi:hypothetical protein
MTGPGHGSELTVTALGVSQVLLPGTGFTFGRGTSCTACLDPGDVGISRLAGSIAHAAGTWWLHNRSAHRPLVVVNHIGLRNVLAPGQRVPVEGRLRVLVEGSRGSHHLDLVGPAPAADHMADAVVGPAQADQPGLTTAIGQGVVITDDDRLALVALFAGYLREGPRYDPCPQSYLAAATRLGWPRTTLVKRIEYLRNRLAKAGVPGMNGHRAMENLAEHVLTTGIIGTADLRRIGG